MEQLLNLMRKGRVNIVLAMSILDSTGAQIQNHLFIAESKLNELKLMKKTNNLFSYFVL